MLQEKNDNKRTNIDNQFKDKKKLYNPFGDDMEYESVDQKLPIEIKSRIPNWIPSNNSDIFEVRKIMVSEKEHMRNLNRSSGIYKPESEVVISKSIIQEESQKQNKKINSEFLKAILRDELNKSLSKRSYVNSSRYNESNMSRAFKKRNANLESCNSVNIKTNFSDYEKSNFNTKINVTIPNLNVDTNNSINNYHSEKNYNSSITNTEGENNIRNKLNNNLLITAANVVIEEKNIAKKKEPHFYSTEILEKLCEEKIIEEQSESVNDECQIKQKKNNNSKKFISASLEINLKNKNKGRSNISHKANHTSVREYINKTREIVLLRHSVEIKKESALKMEEDYYNQMESVKDSIVSLRNAKNLFEDEFFVKFDKYIKHLRIQREREINELTMILDNKSRLELELQKLESRKNKLKDVLDLYREYRDFLICVKEKSLKLPNFFVKSELYKNNIPVNINDLLERLAVESSLQPLEATKNNFRITGKHKSDKVIIDLNKNKYNYTKASNDAQKFENINNSKSLIVARKQSILNSNSNNNSAEKNYYNEKAYYLDNIENTNVYGSYARENKTDNFEADNLMLIREGNINFSKKNSAANYKCTLFSGEYQPKIDNNDNEHSNDISSINQALNAHNDSNKNRKVNKKISFADINNIAILGDKNININQKTTRINNSDNPLENDLLIVNNANMNIYNSTVLSHFKSTNLKSFKNNNNNNTFYHLFADVDSRDIEKFNNYITKPIYENSEELNEDIKKLQMENINLLKELANASSKVNIFKQSLQKVYKEEDKSSFLLASEVEQREITVKKLQEENKKLQEEKNIVLHERNNCNTRKNNRNNLSFSKNKDFGKTNKLNSILNKNSSGGNSSGNISNNFQENSIRKKNNHNIHKSLLKNKFDQVILYSKINEIFNNFKELSVNLNIFKETFVNNKASSIAQENNTDKKINNSGDASNSHALSKNLPYDLTSETKNIEILGNINNNTFKKQNNLTFDKEANMIYMLKVIEKCVDFLLAKEQNYLQDSKKAAQLEKIRCDLDKERKVIKTIQARLKDEKRREILSNLIIERNLRPVILPKRKVAEKMKLIEKSSQHKIQNCNKEENNMLDLLEF